MKKMSPLEKTRGFPFFSSCLMGFPASLVAISNFRRVYFGLGVCKGGRGQLWCTCEPDRHGKARGYTTKRNAHLADEVERARGAAVVVDGEQGQLVPEGDALLVVVHRVHAVVDRVVLALLFWVVVGIGQNR